YVGHLEALQEVNVTAKVQGYLEEIKFLEGSMVKAGDLLFVLEQDLFKADLIVAEARVEQAKAEYLRASQYLTRLKEVKTGGIPQLELDKATADELKARADLKLREAELLKAKLNLGYTQIRSPIGGKVGKSIFKRGDLVGPGSGALVKVVGLDPMRVVFSVPEREISGVVNLKGVKEGLWVELPGNGKGILRIPGEVEFLDNQVDPKTGTLAVYARIQNPQGLLLPGFYVKVLIKEGDGEDKLVIPQRAVLQDQRGRYVFVVEGETATERRIRLGEMWKEGWEVLEGLSEGELLVVEGIQRIRPGIRVIPQEIGERQEKR
ncbi:MAG: efflux RND transporter periplasmic adaptor subunit, partial [Desulfatiglandales bacterium]